MAIQRLFANSTDGAADPTTDSGATSKGFGDGAASQWLFYQTSNSTDIEQPFTSGNNYVYCGGPPETTDGSSYYIAWANSNLPGSSGADGNDYFVMFFGASTGDSSATQLEMLNASCAYIVDLDNNQSALLTAAGYPFSGTSLAAAQALNGGAGVKLACIVVDNGTVVS